MASYVFLGPSLALGEARALLPEARFCPPVRCGDVLALLRVASPGDRIAIIDGGFEHVGAVWHKELLHAMRHGCQLYGAASMGALRAAELHDLGMIGVGEIFASYLDGRLVDDDEVALLHTASGHGHRAVTDAMVNVRATLARAVEAGVVDVDFAANLVASTKAQFYPRRVLAEAVASRSEPQAHALAAWLPLHAVDQKRADAIALLQHLAGGGSPVTPPAAAADSAFLRGLAAYVACRPMPFAADWLPAPERLGRRARLLGSLYLVVRQVALARAFAAACGVPEAPDDEAVVRPLFAQLLREAGWYAAYRAGRDDAEAQASFGLLARLACLWHGLLRHLEQRRVRFAPDLASLRAYASSFQREHGLTSQAALDLWRSANELTAPGAHAQFLLGSMQLARCLHPLAVDLHGIASIDLTRSWFVDTLHESGLDDVLANSDLGARWAHVHGAARDDLARACDLAGGAELELELQRARRAPVLTSDS